MFSLLLRLIFNILLFISLGIALRFIAKDKWKKAIEVFIGVSVYFLIPLFILSSIWKGPLNLFETTEISVLAIFVLAGGLLSAWVWTYFSHNIFANRFLPVAVMNSAYLGIPINTYLWGSEGTLYTIIYSVTISIFHFTVGIWLISKKKSIAEIFKLPFMYAVVAGIVLNVLSIPVPSLISKSGNILSAITLPVMLVFTGYSLGRIKIHIIKNAFLGILLRMGGGFAFALAVITAMKITDRAIIGVSLITSSMPSAVNNYILAEKFDADPEFASASIFLGTLLLVVTIPLIVNFVLTYY
ncbi:MAG: AEC family transporter [Endomicrobiales bacterium]|nr:AEC family transporter [Endomicrobiales bacterium]